MVKERVMIISRAVSFANMEKRKVDVLSTVQKSNGMRVGTAFNAQPS
jgi:hypothetical protein